MTKLPSANPNELESAPRLKPRLRVMLIASASLVVLQAGQILAVLEKVAVSTLPNFTPRSATHFADASGFLFVSAALFIIPSALILTLSVLLAGGVQNKQSFSHSVWLRPLAAINLVIIINSSWYAVSPCLWGQALGLNLTGCP